METKYIDIHAHLNFVAFDEDRDEVIKRTLSDGVSAINVGTQKDTSKSAVDLAHEHDGLFAAVGLHPIHTSKSYHDTDELGEGGKEFTSRGEVFDMSYYSELAKDPKVVAIGECGLDYFRLEEDSKSKQIETFEKQITVANEVKKPLMCHVRNAYKDAAPILKKNSRVLGDMHFFAGTWEEAKMFLDIGFTLSFTGVLTFARDYDEVVRNTPLDMIMAETDCPYVSPKPYRGKRNEPLYVKEVYKAIASIKGKDEELVREALVSNSNRVFNLKNLGLQ